MNKRVNIVEWVWLFNELQTKRELEERKKNLFIWVDPRLTAVCVDMLLDSDINKV